MSNRKSIGSAVFPEIVGRSKASDSTDRGLLDNKDGGMCCRQGVPCLETLFLSHSAVSNSSHLYLKCRFLPDFSSGKGEKAFQMS